MASEMVAAIPAPRHERRFVGRRLKVWIATSVTALVGLVVALFALDAATGNHTLAAITYDQIPPNSGEHSPVWQRCGFYAEPIGDEHAVHSLEHGVIWITYQPDLAQSQVDELRVLARGDDEMLVSPYLELPSPVVVSAWQRQIRLGSADSTLLAQAVGEIRDGLDAPEPGAGCDGPNLWLSGGTGNPEQ